MSQVQLVNQLKFRIASLESTLSDKHKELEEYRDIENQADAKIKAMTKMHAQKVKSLLNSLQIVKKQKAAIEGLSKQHKRSKLIEQLNREILDQDIVIEVLRKFVYEDKGKQSGRQICDDIIVKALTKGPERVRPLTREELRMEIDKLKNINLNLDSKIKIGGGGGNKERGANRKQEDDGEISEISSVSERSFMNQNQQILRKLRQAQTEAENLKLQLGSKGKIIEKLRSEAKQKDRLRAECQLLANELQLAGRKVSAYEELLRSSRQSANQKAAELYERQLRVEELEMDSKESGERLKQAAASTGIQLEEARQEKEQIKVELELLRKENQNLMLQNITMKKRNDEQKAKITEVRELNIRSKEELSQKLAAYQSEIAKVMAENNRMSEIARQTESKLFAERANWIEEKSKLIAEIQQLENNGKVAAIQGQSLEEIDKLRKENRDLKQLMEGGMGKSSDNKVLLQRLEAYRQKLQFYESKDDKAQQREMYNDLFTKYNTLLEEMEILKKHGPQTISRKKKAHVQVTAKDQQRLGDLSSGVSGLGLEDPDSDILDNFDSSYQYELHVNQIDAKKYPSIPRLSEEDKELLKLLNSDLWDFVKDDRVGNRLEELVADQEAVDQQNDEDLQRRIKQIKNLSHPMGHKLTLYDSELRELDAMSESVSATSAIARDVEKYDSDVDIEVRRQPQGTPAVNLRGLKTISDSYSSIMEVSSAKSGESSFAKKRKGEKEKATILKRGKDSMGGSSVSVSLNSDVSSMNINESALAGMNSDVSVDFRKKTRK